MPLITVFTPTYNRAGLLARLFNSLRSQTLTDFEWVIVDDGSTDETENTVKGFVDAAGGFPIRYFKKQNGGKHTAINFGVEVAEGELFFIADSDDTLPADSLDTVIKYWNEIKDNNSFAGVCGLDEYSNSEIIGSGLPAEVIDASSLYVRFKLGVKGDMKEVFRTSVLKEFPFPVIDGEKFCPEMLVWNRIASKYILRYFNKPIYVVDYQKDGISSNIIKSRMLSPVGTTITYYEMTTYKLVPFAAKIKAAINYWRFKFCIKDKERLNQIPSLGGWLNIVAPIGWLMHKRDVEITHRSCLSIENI